MKIESLNIRDYPPIKSLKIEEMGNMVIIAGANGSGKTRLKDAIVGTLQGSSLMGLTIKATREEEKSDFVNDNASLNVNQGEPNDALRKYMVSRRFGRGNYVGSLLQIDSQRHIQPFQIKPLNRLPKDPDVAEMPSNFYFSNFIDRWQNFMRYIHEKVASHDRQLAEAVREGASTDLSAREIYDAHLPPLNKYKDIFSRIVPDKELMDLNVDSPGEFQYTDSNGQRLAFQNLSSGEQEVVKILFDFARRNIRHSVILFDEPELHLHPTLTFRMIEELKSMGDGTNQFIFFTHSADLISTYYSTGDVYFIDTDQSSANQAHRLSQLNQSHDELVRLMANNLGLFTAGKKLVFVEGEDSSLDKLTYHRITQEAFPEARIVPAGSVSNISSLNLLAQQMQNTIYGIDFYMIRDRDGLSDDEVQKVENNGRVRCLKRRHLENYFLDPDVLFEVAQKLYISHQDVASADIIRSKIQNIAASRLGYTLMQNTRDYLVLNRQLGSPTVKDLDTKTVSIIKQEIVSSVSDSLTQLASDESEAALKEWLDREEATLRQSLKNDGWMTTFHGKEIFGILCSKILQSKNKSRIRQAYLDVAMKIKPEVFTDIREILESFNR